MKIQDLVIYSIFAVDGQLFPSWVTAFVLLFIIAIVGLIYKKFIDDSESINDIPKPIFLIFNSINWVSKMSEQILGKCYIFAVPFFLYIMSYFWLGSILSILGLPTLASNVAVPASVSLIVFLGTIISGFYFKRISYLNDFVFWIKIKKKKIIPIPDPLKVIGELSKIISLTCRLWGNCLAGSVIIFVCYYSIGGLFNSLNAEWAGILAIPSIVFPLHIYFDIIDGAIQSLIFMLLTMSYWSIAALSEDSSNYKHK